MEGFTVGTIVLVALAIFAIVILAKGIRIVQQSEVMIIERLGRYHKTLHSGINVIIPIIDQPRSILWRFSQEIPNGGFIVRHIAKERIDLRETVYDFPKQNVITRDNIVTEINALIYFQVMDPVRSVYEISNLPQAIEKLTQTSLRNVIGDLDLDQTLTSRDTINSRLREILDEATNKWGVKVNRVELQDINPPRDIRDAMEKQMRAERDKRATILEAEGAKQSQILYAEGQMEAQIKKAEGSKRSQILEAEGQAEARIAVANAEATAIERVTNSLKDTGTTDPAQYLIAV
ncbi:MAG: SPFH/Band 7/PHB domain protein, partial [Flavobacteriales bacterium]|nr:SPFH/Band 7/PHB domain protein [Flavobacteriales bacterium]